MWRVVIDGNHVYVAKDRIMTTDGESWPKNRRQMERAVRKALKVCDRKNEDDAKANELELYGWAILNAPRGDISGL